MNVMNILQHMLNKNWNLNTSNNLLKNQHKKHIDRLPEYNKRRRNQCNKVSIVNWQLLNDNLNIMDRTIGIFQLLGNNYLSNLCIRRHLGIDDKQFHIFGKSPESSQSSQ